MNGNRLNFIDLTDLANGASRLAQSVADGVQEKISSAYVRNNVELGTPLLPHVTTFQAFASTLSGIYYPTDSAIRKSWENARFMKADLAVMECVEKRRRDVALLEWHVVSDNKTDPRIKEAARLVEKIIKKTPNFLKFRETLLYAVWYGKYGVQMTWGRTLVEGKERFYVADWLPINGDKLVYKVRKGNPFERDRVGVRVGYGASRGREINLDQVESTENGMAYFFTEEQLDRILIHNHMIEDGDYDDPYSGGSIYGVGIRSRIFYTWYLMKQTLGWLMNYLERSATGFEIWYYPSGNQQAKEAIKEAAENRVGEGGNIVLIPQQEGQNGPAFQMQRIEPSMQGAETCRAILEDYFGDEIRRYVLGQTLTTKAGSTGLGSNLGSIQLETYLEIVKYDALNLQETLDKLVELIRKYNFPFIDEGELHFNVETDEIDHKERLDAIRACWDMGAKISEREVLSAAGLSEPSKEDRILDNPAFQQTQQQAIGGDFGNEYEQEGTADSGDYQPGKDPQFRGVRGVRERPGLPRTRAKAKVGARPVLREKRAAESRKQVEQAY